MLMCRNQILFLIELRLLQESWLYTTTMCYSHILPGLLMLHLRIILAANFVLARTFCFFFTSAVTIYKIKVIHYFQFLSPKASFPITILCTVVLKALSTCIFIIPQHLSM